MTSSVGPESEVHQARPGPPNGTVSRWPARPAGRSRLRRLWRRLAENAVAEPVGLTSCCKDEGIADHIFSYRCCELSSAVANVGANPRPRPRGTQRGYSRDASTLPAVQGVPTGTREANSCRETAKAPASTHSRVLVGDELDGGGAKDEKPSRSGQGPSPANGKCDRGRKRTQTAAQSEHRGGNQRRMSHELPVPCFQLALVSQRLIGSLPEAQLTRRRTCRSLRRWAGPVSPCPGSAP